MHNELIEHTYNSLEEAVAKGYGKNWKSNKSTHFSTVQQLKSHIYQFSGAKTYQQLAEMNSFLVDEKGKIRSFSEFKRKVDVVHEKYNKNYLQAEYQTAKKSAQAARQWKGYEANKDLFPNLKYMTIGDDKVRDQHSKLHGIIKPVDDPFWNTHYPPNGWRCRCYVQPTTEGATTIKTTVAPDKGFEVNVGKTQQIFHKKEHPYYVFPSKEKEAYKTAFENFKLTAPYGKARFTADNGARVFVSPFTDTRADELIGNYRVAVEIAKQTGFDVKLRPHIDGRILKAKNPEYLIDGKLADRKAPGSKNYKNILRSANKQETEIVVIDLHNNKDTIENASLKIDAVLSKSNVHPNIKEYHIISADRKQVSTYKRKKQS